MILGLCGNAGSGKSAVARMLQKHGWVEVALADPLKRIVSDVYSFTDAQLWGASRLRNAPDFRWPHGAPEYRDAAENEFQIGKGLAERALIAGETREERDVLVENHFKSAVNYALEGWLTPRHALQQLGTNFGRWCSPDTWIRYALNIHDRLRTGDHRYDARHGLRSISSLGDLVFPHVDVVISDVRFKNEIDAIHHAGGKVVRLVRQEQAAAAELFQLFTGVVPQQLSDLVKDGCPLATSATQHVSETEQRELPVELFDYRIHNEGISLDELAVRVSELDAALRAA